MSEFAEKHKYPDSLLYRAKPLTGLPLAGVGLGFPHGEKGKERITPILRALKPK